VKLERLDARMLWSTGHYDGPCSGVAVYLGQYYLFELLGSPTSRHGKRAYTLHPLTAEEFEQELARQQVFRELVGLHCDYDENGKRGEPLPGAGTPEGNARWTLYCERMRSMPESREVVRARPAIGYYVRK
jgi:hypothetical protein